VQPRPPWLAYALIVGAALAAFGSALPNPWHLDDNVIVLGDQRVRDFEVARIFSEHYWPGGYSNLVYRPLTQFTLAVNWALSPTPWTFRLTNLLIHAWTGIALFLLVRRLGGGGFVALAAGLLYVTHPVHTTPLNQIIDRADLAAAACVITALWLATPTRAPEGRSWGAIGAAALLYAAGLLFKESAVVLPLLLACCDAWRRCAAHPARALRGVVPAALSPGLKIRALALYAALVLVLSGYVALRSAVLGGMTRSAALVNALDNPIANPQAVGVADQDAPLARWGTPIAVVATAARVLVWPARLSWDYSYAAISPVVSWGDAQLWMGVAVLGVCLAVAMIGWRRGSLAFVGVALMLGAYSVVSNTLFVIGAAFAERYLVLPCAGFAILLAGLLGGLGERRFAVVLRVALLVGCVGAYGGRSAVRNLDFQSAARLDRSEVEHQPRSSRLWSAAARAAENSGDHARAFQLAQAALKIYDRNPEAWRVLGVAAVGLRQPEPAIDALRRALQCGDAFNEATHVTLAQILRAQGDYRGAIEQLEAHVPLNRNAATARNNLAWYLVTADPPELRDPVRACRYASEAVELEPAAADFLDTYLTALTAAGRAAEVRRVLRERAGGIDDPGVREALLKKWGD